MTSPVQPGDVIAGKYRVERVIGEGGMGVVVAATHLELDQLVALKFLLPEAFANLEAIQRFVREARAAAKIKSEHVARVLDTGRLENGAPYQVMEFLEGDDLARVLEMRTAVSVEEAVSFILQASEALAEAHAAGIVHRDLKPANLFLARRADRSQIIKVLDFGISKNIAATGTDKQLTKSNAIVGSPYYMSPEQLTYGKPIDPRCDVWALGIILYELISGAPPFNGETLPQIVAGILSNRPRSIAELRPGIPAPIVNAITRCMQTDPDQRFSSVAELAAAIAPCGPAGSRESAETIARVLGVSLAPAFQSTMAEETGPGLAPPPYHSGNMRVGVATGGSATAAPWSRTNGGVNAVSTPPGATNKSMAGVVVAVAATFLVLGLGGTAVLLALRSKHVEADAGVLALGGDASHLETANVQGTTAPPTSASVQAEVFDASAAGTSSALDAAVATAPTTPTSTAGASAPPANATTNTTPTNSNSAPTHHTKPDSNSVGRKFNL